MSPAPEISPQDTCTTDSFLAGVPCALCLVDDRDHLGPCNDSFARLFETSPQRILGRAVTDFIPDALWRQAVQQPEKKGVVGECFRGDAPPFTAELVVRPLDGHAPSRRLLSVHAASSHAAVPASRDNHLEGLATLAGGVAHEFNNVLTIVLGYGDLLPDMASDPARLREIAGHIMTAARRGADVVYQLQLFARTEECPRTPHALHQLMRHAVAHTARNWPASITVTFALSPAPDVLMLNAPQFILALQHLLQNARQSLPLDTGCITVRTTHHPEHDPPQLCLSIEDTGIGMDEATRRRVIDPFFTQRRAGRRGLGLTVVHGIIKAHGGRIEVDSPPQGGAHVQLWFPFPATDPFANALPLSFTDEERQQCLIDAVRSAPLKTPLTGTTRT